MTDYAAILAERFPVRKTKAQKQAFREWLTEELKALGCEPREETNGHLRARSILVGDPEHSAVLFVCHYDTPPRWILPDLWFPRNLLLWSLVQLLHMLLLLLPALAVYLSLWRLTGGNAQIGLWGLVLTYLGMLALNQFGPANRTNRGEDADVAAMLDLLASLPEEDRAKAAWLFADQGCRGGNGARAWGKANPLAAYTRLTVAFARLGGGDHLLAAGTRLAAKCTGWGALAGALSATDGLKTTVTGARFCTVRGDRRAFRCGVSLTGCKYSRLADFWANGGRTPADSAADMETVGAVCEALKRFLGQLTLYQNGKKKRTARREG